MKKCVIIANRILFVSYIVFYSFIIATVVWLYFISLPAAIIMTIELIFALTISVFTTERWCVRLLFTEQGITYKPLFRKEKYLKYGYYPRLYYACYMHGNPFAKYEVPYFVFTNKNLNTYELSHINKVAPNIDLIKIRYTRKTYHALLQALPKPLARDLERMYRTYIQKN